MRGKSGIINKGDTRQVSVIFRPSDQGHYADTVNLVFNSFDKDELFVISRKIEATVGSRRDHEQLKAKAPYSRRKVHKFNPVGNIVPSLRPPGWTKTKWAEKLPRFDPPQKLIQTAFGPDATKRPLAKVKPLMPLVFDEKTYAAWFQVLLWVDEEHTKYVCCLKCSLLYLYVLEE